jgi:hypothetical protein
MKIAFMSIGYYFEADALMNFDVQQCWGVECMFTDDNPDKRINALVKHPN